MTDLFDFKMFSRKKLNVRQFSICDELYQEKSSIGRAGSFKRFTQTRVTATTRLDYKNEVQFFEVQVWTKVFQISSHYLLQHRNVSVAAYETIK